MGRNGRREKPHAYNTVIGKSKSSRGYSGELTWALSSGYSSHCQDAQPCIGQAGGQASPGPALQPPDLKVSQGILVGQCKLTKENPTAKQMKTK